MRLRGLYAMTAAEAFELAKREQWYCRPVIDRLLCQTSALQSIQAILINDHVNKIVLVEALTSLKVKDLAQPTDVPLVQAAMRVMHEAQIIEIDPGEALEGEFPRARHVGHGHHYLQPLPRGLEQYFSNLS